MIRRHGPTTMLYLYETIVIHYLPLVILQAENDQEEEVRRRKIFPLDRFFNFFFLTRFGIEKTRFRLRVLGQIKSELITALSNLEYRSKYQVLNSKSKFIK